MDNKTKILLVEMETKIIGPRKDTYSDKFKKLLHSKEIDKGSKTIALKPTFNDKQLISVGGRVKISDIFANSSHQIIISRHHPIAKLII